MDIEDEAFNETVRRCSHGVVVGIYTCILLKWKCVAILRWLLQTINEKDSITNLIDAPLSSKNEGGFTINFSHTNSVVRSAGTAAVESGFLPWKQSATSTILMLIVF